MLASQHLPESFNAAEWFVGRHVREGRAERVAIVEADIKDLAKAELAPYKCPRHVTVVSELPKTATGKTQRFRLRAASRD